MEDGGSLRTITHSAFSEALELKRQELGVQVETLGSECGRPISSVAWSTRGTYLAAGCDSGAVQIYDAATASPSPYMCDALRACLPVLSSCCSVEQEHVMFILSFPPVR